MSPTSPPRLAILLQGHHSSSYMYSSTVAIMCAKGLLPIATTLYSSKDTLLHLTGTSPRC